MENLLVDLHIAQAMSQESGWDSLDQDYKQTLYFATVLEKHGVTKADFDTSLTYYYVRADRFSEIYKNVANRLSDKALAMGSTEGEVNRISVIMKASSDTVDVWRGKLSVMLTPFAPYNRYDFIQKADTSFRKGDSFMFVLYTDFIYQSGSRNATACISMKYDNDSIVSRNINLSSSGINQVRIPQNGNHMVKEIRGFIYLAPEKEASTTLKLMAVKNIQLFKFRKKQKEEKKDETAKDSVDTKKKQPIDSLKTKTL